MKPNDETRERQPFGLPSATALVIANMIGAGVFTTSGFSYGDLGNRALVLLAWCVGGLIAAAGAYSYGLLATRIQESGGEYVFLSRAVHPAIGFTAGWVSLLAGFTGAIAFAARAFEAYAFPSGLPGLPEGTAAMASVVLFALLHAFLLRHGLRTQNALVLVKLALLTAFLMFAGWKLTDGSFEGLSTRTQDQGTFEIVSFAGALVWISLSYSGFNAAVYVCAEVKHRERNVARALLLGTLITTIFYILLNAVFLYAASPEAIRFREDVATPAAEGLGGPFLANLVRLIICLALLSSVSSMIIAGPRVYAQMARDRVFPRLFEDSRHRNAIFLQALLALLVISMTTLEDLLSYLGFTLSLSAAGTVACLLFTKRHRPSGAWHTKLIPGFYVLATLFLALLAARGRPAQFQATCITLFSGLLLYIWIQRARKRQ